VEPVDVAVVGAGPAGVAAAVTLARSGRHVVLLDKARFPRDKCCGDGLTTGALRLLEDLGLDPVDVASWQPVDDVFVRGPAGHEVRFPLPRGRGAYAAVARRVDLDAALVDLARRAGATVVEGRAVVGAEAGPDRVVLHLEDGSALAARFVVGADGMWSPLRKHLGGPATRRDLGEWHAFRQYFRAVGPRAASELHVWFEPDLLPGYAWSFPVAGGGANVGFGIQRGGSVTTQAMGRLWPELLARPHVREVLGPDATPEGPHKAWPIPAAIEAATLSAAGGRALFVGDAAAATDPLTGEGIGQALLTGTLAARAVLGSDEPDRVAGDYAAAVRRELVPDARLSQLLIRAVRHRRGVRAALRVAGATGWTRRSFGRWLFEDYPRAYVATPARWREHSFTGDGAWARSARPSSPTGRPGRDR
jgi:geranylgeranyl reductase family protein